jgi:hypothetical protein
VELTPSAGRTHYRACSGDGLVESVRAAIGGIGKEIGEGALMTITPKKGTVEFDTDLTAENSVD